MLQHASRRGLPCLKQQQPTWKRRRPQRSGGGVSGPPHTWARASRKYRGAATATHSSSARSGTLQGEEGAWAHIVCCPAPPQAPPLTALPAASEARSRALGAPLARSAGQFPSHVLNQTLVLTACPPLLAHSRVFTGQLTTSPVGGLPSKGRLLGAGHRPGGGVLLRGEAEHEGRHKGQLGDEEVIGAALEGVHHLQHRKTQRGQL